MTERLEDDADEVMKVLTRHGVTRQLGKEARIRVVLSPQAEDMGPLPRPCRLFLVFFFRIRDAARHVQSPSPEADVATASTLAPVSSG